MPCFGCDHETGPETQHGTPSKTGYNFMGPNQEYDVFQVTAQSCRVICGVGPQGYQRCLLRIDRAIQLRRVSHQRALQFIQYEQYFIEEDMYLLYTLLYKQKVP